MDKKYLNKIADLIYEWVRMEQDNREDDPNFRENTSKELAQFIYYVLSSKKRKLKECLYQGKIYRYLHPIKFYYPNPNVKISDLYYSWAKKSDFHEVAKFEEKSYDGVTIIEGDTETEYGIDVVAFENYYHKKTRKRVLWGAIPDENEIIFTMSERYIKKIYRCNAYEQCDECGKIFAIKHTIISTGDDIYKCPYCGCKMKHNKDSYLGYHFQAECKKIEDVSLNKYDNLILKL